MAFVRNTRRVPMTLNATQGDSLAFHRQMPGYAPTPLRHLTELAHDFGIGNLLVKDESNRFGLPSFKILGASWAIHRALQHPNSYRTLVAATDGNHGRAVAFMARRLGLNAIILVPDDMAQARREAITSEGAQVVVVHGSYDDAVERSAAYADDFHLVVSDTAWEGYEDIPRYVIEGYETIFAEVDDQTTHPPDVIFVQMGVGALASAVVLHYRRQSGQAPIIIGVEPDSAACVLESIRAGQIVTVPGPHPSIMAGLNCGIPSKIGFPLLLQGMDAVISVSDDRARQAIRLLARHGMTSGETGAAGLAGLLDMLETPELRDFIPPQASVLVISTEGITDPLAYQKIMGSSRA